MERTQFTFYESFFKAISRIKDDEARCKAYDAICEYALYGTEPDMDQIPDASAIVFELSKPNLDASRQKAESGKRGGKSKQNESKTEANEKQNESKTEAKPKQTEAKPKQTASKKEKEKEKEYKNECYPPISPLFGEELQKAVDDWLEYKRERREGYKPTGLKALESEIRNNAATYGEGEVAKLIRSCMAAGWKGIAFDRLGAKQNSKPKATNGPTYNAPSAEQMRAQAEQAQREREFMMRVLREEVNA